MSTTESKSSRVRRLFRRKPQAEDFSIFCGEKQASTKKERLLRECNLCGVSPYVDDATETSHGIYSAIRAVASEAELEMRLNAKNALGLASRANIVAILALLVSLTTLVKSFLWP